jgi:hypothetical protein
MRAMMKIALATVLVGALLGPELATSVQAAPARPNRIGVRYVPPKNAAHQPIYQRLMEVRFLEKLQEFLSPFRLPRTLLIKTEGCDGESNAWYDNDAITICYEYIDEMWKYAPTETTPAGVTPIDGLVAPIFDTSLHEFGHAIFEILKVPVFGREEDAADQLAAYIALHFGKSDVRRYIGGVAYAYMTEAKAATTPPKLEQFANVHGTPAQRFYNVLCIAYGADPKSFGDFVEKGYLPKDRAEGCEDEYQQVAFAFAQLVQPHIDRRIARKVLSKSWLPDAGRRLQHRPSTN